MEAKAYAYGKADPRRLWLCFISKWWLILIFALTGALLGSGLNCLYRGITDKGPKYKAEVKMYIDYATDEKDEAYMYFNDYTWKTIIATDEVLGLAGSELSGITKAEIAEGLDAHTPSDIRVMTVTLETDSKDKSDAALKAIASAIEEYGRQRKEFNAITVMDYTSATRVIEASNLLNAAMVGMITAVIIICIVLLIMYSCDDRIRVEGDLQPMVSVPFIGYSERENDFEEEIQKSIEHLASKVSDSENGDLSDGDAGMVSGTVEPVYVSADADDTDYEAISGKACVVTVVFGKTTVQMLCNVLAKLSLYDCEVLGVVIAKTDRKFLCRYFGRVKA